VVDSFCEGSIQAGVNQARAAREAVAHKERRYASR
jgi:hypothetical protein